jgi:hypothetical protein
LGNAPYLTYFPNEMQEESPVTAVFARFAKPGYYPNMSLPPPIGLHWVPGVSAAEIQKMSGLHIESQSLAYTCKATIQVVQPDMWRAINGLLGLQKDHHNRYYLGAPHPAFVERVNDETMPMRWADSIDNLNASQREQARQAEERELKKLWGSINSEDIELFPYFGDSLAQSAFASSISNNVGVVSNCRNRSRQVYRKRFETVLYDMCASFAPFAVKS